MKQKLLFASIISVFLMLYWCGCRQTEIDKTTAIQPEEKIGKPPETQETSKILAKPATEKKGAVEEPVAGQINKIPEPYLIRVGDVLEISILDEPEMTREVTVIPDGTITYLLIGEIPAEGQTIKELRLNLTEKIKQFFVDPHVSIITKKLQQADKENMVSIVGALKNPGKYKLEKGDRIIDVMARAGGLLFINDELGGRSLANLKSSYFSRNGQKIKVDFYRLLQKGDMKHNLLLEPGDFIYITEPDIGSISVLGEVNLPQIIPNTKDISIVEAISRSGGFTDYAQRTRVMVLRSSLPDKKKFIDVNVESLLLGKNEKNIILKDGDIVFVPEQGLSEYSRYAEYLITFGDLILQGYRTREAVRFPRIHRKDKGL